ncbi:hypothetical protein [Luteolibacter sp. LG18]|uniref:hypothetical protein n=1 Tax=Luteolibacter sp. LG18 TaxID=2819286 RepID=UPI0030C6878A
MAASIAVGMVIGPIAKYVFWRQVPATITITAPPGQFSKIEMGTEYTRTYTGNQITQLYGPARPLAHGWMQYPASYGVYSFRLTLADERVCTISYPHYDAGVRRKAVIHLKQLAKDRCQVEIWLNEVKQGTVEFDPSDAADHRVPRDYEHYDIPSVFRMPFLF